ncbi:MAG: FAD-dependent oxidoreductase, partial [Firmicutes bacterium]|nr:FAD-dependent oxidoreductase [Bacillota bacterium]
VTIGDGILHPTVVDTGYLPSPKVMACMDDSISFFCHAVDEIHRYNSVACLQLNHAGMLSTSDEFSGWGPDYINFEESDYTAPLSEQEGKGEGSSRKGIVQYMTEEMIEEIVEGFGDSARRAQFCGFDMVQLHAAHGWLIHQFLSPLTNHRTDRFGGSLENRARFLMMIVERIRQYCGEDFLIEARLSGTDYVENGGYTLDDAIEVCKMLDGKVDLLHISCGNFVYPETEALLCPTIFKANGYNVYLAEAIKKEVKISKVSTIGGINDPAMMEEIIASGKADMVALGRALIADPQLPNKARRGQEGEIRPCIRCTFCLADYQRRAQRCSVNPTFHRPYEALLPQKTAVPQKVLIAGGGPAGLQAAVTARERGHEVILCEKRAELGGLIRYSRKVSFKYETEKYMDYMINKAQRMEVEIRLNTEVTPELVAEIKPDYLIAAVGSEAFVPPVEGVEKAHMLMDVYDNNIEIADTVAVIGGGIAGSEFAIEQAMAGKNVILLEMGNALAKDANNVHKSALMDEFEARKDKITIMKKTRCTKIGDGTVTCINADGEEVEIKAESVVIAAGMRARKDVVESLRFACDEFNWVGDCKQPRQIRHAVLEGYDAAMDI